MDIIQRLKNIVTTTGFRNYAIMRPTSSENVAYTLNMLAIGRWK